MRRAPARSPLAEEGNVRDRGARQSATVVATGGGSERSTSWPTPRRGAKRRPGRSGARDRRRPPLHRGTEPAAGANQKDAGNGRSRADDAELIDTTDLIGRRTVVRRGSKSFVRAPPRSREANRYRRRPGTIRAERRSSKLVHLVAPFSANYAAVEPGPPWEAASSSAVNPTFSWIEPGASSAPHRPGASRSSAKIEGAPRARASAS